MKRRWRIAHGISISLQKEIEDIILHELDWKKIARGKYIKKGQIINELVNDLQCGIDHLHTVSCASQSSAFDQNSSQRKWNISLEELSTSMERSFYLDDGSYLLQDYPALDNTAISSIEINFLGYLLEKANNYTTKYLYGTTFVSTNVNALLDLNYFVGAESKLNRKLTENNFPLIKKEHDVITGLYIEDFIIIPKEGLKSFPESINLSFIRNSFIRSDKAPLKIRHSIIVDSFVEVFPSTFGSPPARNPPMYSDLGLWDNDIYSSNILIFTPDQNITPSELVLCDCRFSNSIISTLPNPVHDYKFRHNPPIKIIFKNCLFNNTVINGYIEKGIDVKFEDCTFTNSSSKFEIEEIT